jgi:hypothetical protein
VSRAALLLVVASVASSRAAASVVGRVVLGDVEAALRAGALVEAHAWGRDDASYGSPRLGVHAALVHRF